MPATRVPADSNLPVLGFRAGDLPPRVLVVGDPRRAELAAERLSEKRELGRTREYVSFAGTHGATEVAVVSHGVGSAGAAVCFEELFRAGAERVIRAGTAGGMQPNVVDGDLVVATAAVRSDGFTQQVVPPEFPAVADPEIVSHLVAAGRGLEFDVHQGIVVTVASFYTHAVLGSSLPTWQEAGVVAVEMEVAALFVLASLHGSQAGAILAIDGNPLLERDESMEGYNPNRPVVHEAVERMITIALDALVR
jgi:uridine phosphorylase